MDSISSDQWTVIGMLLILMIAELILHPSVSSGLISFLSAFKPAKGG